MSDSSGIPEEEGDVRQLLPRRPLIANQRRCLGPVTEILKRGAEAAKDRVASGFELAS